MILLFFKSINSYDPQLLNNSVYAVSLETQKYECGDCLWENTIAVYNNVANHVFGWEIMYFLSFTLSLRMLNQWCKKVLHANVLGTKAWKNIVDKQVYMW